MSKMRIIGGNHLSGTIKISGAKNSVVALIPAAILTDEEVTIENVPEIADIDALEEILNYLNITYTRTPNTIKISSKNLVNKEIPVDMAERLRASYYFMGALLGKDKTVTMSFPGGCKIGARPINLHLLAFEKLGTRVDNIHGTIKLTTDQIIGNEISLDIASVGATINIMLAAAKSKGITTIENAAREPEIVDVANFLNAMGAKISGAGSGVIRISGVDYLGSCIHEVIPDRIEAGTYAIIGSLMGESLVIDKMIPEHILSVITKLKEAGANIKVGTDYLLINKAEKLKAVNIKTQVYPGFPTDLQQPMTALLTQCEGESTVDETIYETRFGNVAYLKKMGADIDLHEDGKSITVRGKTELHGEEITSTDLRAGSCLVIASLLANGETMINNMEHVYRGYEDIDIKLNQVGAKIKKC